MFGIFLSVKIKFITDGPRTTLSRYYGRTASHDPDL